MTFTDLFVYVLSGVAIHQLWLYEDIFSGLLRKVSQYKYLKFLWCPSCFAFWAAILALPAFVYSYIYAPLVAYVCISQISASMVRDHMSSGQDPEQVTFTPPSHALSTHHIFEPARPAVNAFEQAAVPEPGCKSCADKARKWSGGGRDKKVLVIMTALADFDSSYSLVTVILDQCRAGILAGFYVELWGMENMRIAKLPHDLKKQLESGTNFNCRGALPPLNWEEDVIKPDDERHISNALAKSFREAGITASTPAAIITHDFIFQSWYLAIAKTLHGLEDVSPFKECSWFHQVHSSVGERPVPNIARWRAQVPSGHKMAAVNYSDISHLCAYYQAGAEQFVTIPNSRDIRFFMHMSDTAQDIITSYDVLSRDIVQTYPLSSPRMDAKGVGKVIDVFSALKAAGKDVLLILANAHANGEDGLNKIRDLRLYAEKQNMADNIVFTSEAVPVSNAVGLDEDTIRSLFLVSNVFCFPSVSESCGLVMLEAALANNLLVLNQSLTVLHDFIPHEEAIYVPWGSSRIAAAPMAARHVAGLILDRLDANLMNTAKRRVLKNLSVDALALKMKDVLL